MMQQNQIKAKIRQSVKEEKSKHSHEDLQRLSEDIMRRLEKHPRFLEARTVLMYYSLPDEPATASFIERWHSQKHILLPVVCGDRLNLKTYSGNESLREGAFHIMEPVGADFKELNRIDLAVIPGVAFDTACRRLGRGRGYYDRLLSAPDLRAYRLGICFPFQVIEKVPSEPHDATMDEILTV